MRGQQQLRHLAPLLKDARLFTTSQAAQQHAPAVAKSSGSFFRSGRVDTPLNEPLAGVPSVRGDSAPVTPPKVETSTLDNGLRCASISQPGPLASLGVMVSAGSAHETSDNTGAAKFLEYIAFKASSNRSTFRLTRELEKFGAVAKALSSREYSAFVIDVVKLHVPEGVELLLDAVLNPRINTWEVDDLQARVQAELAAALEDPTQLVPEVLHRAAFDGGLGQALLPHPSLVDRLTADKLKSWVDQHFQPGRMVLAAAGVDHAQLQQLAGPLLQGGSSAAGGSAAAPASKYLGGSMNVMAASDKAYVAVAFEAKGGLSDPKGAATAAVVKQLLDETRSSLPWVRKQADGVDSSTPLAHLYKDTGLLGLLVSTGPGGATSAIDSITKKFEALTKSVPEAQLAQAKHLALSNYQAALQRKEGVVKELGLQLLTRGKFDPNDYASQVNSLTAADINSYVQTALKSAPSVVTYGNLTALPRYDAVAKRFK